jgi:hypothetical protein
MSLLKKAHWAFATIFVGVLLTLAARTSHTQVYCKEIRLKPLHGVCGKVIDQAGGPVAHATVTVLKNGVGIATAQTGEDGKFSVEGLNAGSYEILAEATGFPGFRFPVVVEKPAKICKRVLQVELRVGRMENCGGTVRIVKQ